MLNILTITFATITTYSDHYEQTKFSISVQHIICQCKSVINLWLVLELLVGTPPQQAHTSYSLRCNHGGSKRFAQVAPKEHLLFDFLSPDS
jgi:hypothetical protein